MDDERFDALSRVLGTGASRRSVFGVLAGVAALGASEAAAKRRQRGGKRRSKAAGRVRVAAQGDKVTICHRTGSEKKPYQVISVDPRALPAHQAHGDVVCDAPQVLDVAACTCSCPDPVCDDECPLGFTCTTINTNCDTACCGRVVLETGCTPDGTSATILCGTACIGGDGGGSEESLPCSEAEACSLTSPCPAGFSCLASACCGRSICVSCAGGGSGGGSVGGG
jgi:hypothetical protein